MKKAFLATCWVSQNEFERSAVFTMQISSRKCKQILTSEEVLRLATEKKSKFFIKVLESLYLFVLIFENQTFTQINLAILAHKIF